VTAIGERPAGERGRLAGLAANRDFRLLWSGQVASEFGTSLSGLALPLLVLALSGDPWLAGLAGTVSFTAMWLAQLPAGYVADMFDRRRVMLCCDALRAVLFGAVGFGVLAGVVPAWALLGVAAVSTFTAMLFGAAEGQALRQLVPLEQRPEAVSVTQARGFAVSLTGPAVAGWLFAAGRALPMLADACSYLISYACVRRIRAPLAATGIPSWRRLLPDVGEGWKVLWRTRYLRSSVQFTVLENLTGTALLFLLILGGGDSLGIGLSLSLAAAAGLAGSALAPRAIRRVPLRLLLGLPPAVRAGLLLLAAWIGHPVLLTVVIATGMLLVPMSRAASGVAAMRVVPAELLGRTGGATRFLCSSLQPLAPLAAGLLLSGLSARGGELVLAGASALVTLIVLSLPGLDVPLRD
jgi:MFS family permease